MEKVVGRSGMEEDRVRVWEGDRLQARVEDRVRVWEGDKDEDRASEAEGAGAEVGVSVWGQAENATAPTVNTVNPINRESHATPGSALNVAHP